MDVTLELNNRYHERQKEKNSHQEKKSQAPKLNSSHPQSSSSSSTKRYKPHSSLLNKDFKLMNSEKERRIKEVLCTYFGGKHSLESCFKRPQNQFAQLSEKFPSQGKAILIDPGATNSFIPKQFVHKYSLTTSQLPEKIPLIILDPSESPSLFVTHHTKYMVELPSFPSFYWDFLVIDTPKILSPGQILLQSLAIDFTSHRTCLHARTALQMRLQHCPPISSLTTPYAFTFLCLPSLHSHVALPKCLQHSLLSLRSCSALLTWLQFRLPSLRLRSALLTYLQHSIPSLRSRSALPTWL
ncbi:hypothetical protein O181_052166 [Austropuccinia psidii MF-1]|uniref:Uncharacterized protein n=1 Tax=Austropuccinia psidii MF-1 TaxID=1389203 RepID=A0A9Q3E534_9BASI|nr:hypothetical protein [Austropuccinia psidii MF-1]